MPGFGIDEKPLRKQTTPAGHQQRLNQVRKSMVADIAQKEKEKSFRVNANK